MNSNVLNLLNAIHFDCGLSQGEIAEKLNVSQATVSRWMTKGVDPRGSMHLAIQKLYNELKGMETGSIVPLMGYIGAGTEIDPSFEQVPDSGLYQIDLPFLLKEDMVAFEIQGESMFPVYKEGDLIIVKKRQTKTIEFFYGKEAVVLTSDNKRYIKTISKGLKGIDLLSWNAPPIENVKVEWLGEIFAVLKHGMYTKNFYFD
ncbi:S24 family peptidase [Bartonella sp. DGB1]|uniref:S24 family peptidase n=1 Tax=Bartonella sp. DGB1 TaxID=3239807 RepID=UPI003523AF6E